MAATNFFVEPKSREGNGGSCGSSSIREWISPSEFRRRFERQIGTSSDGVHRVVNYPVTSANQVQEGSRVQSPYYLLSVPLSFSSATTSVKPLTGPAVKEGMRMGSPCYLSSPLFCSLPPTVARPSVDAHGFLHSPGRNQEDLTLQLMPPSSSSSSSSSRTTRLAFSNPSRFYIPQRGKVSVCREDENGCDLELRLNTRWNEGESVSDIQKNKRPSFPTKLLVGQEEEGGGHKNKKARINYVGSGSAALGSSSCEEIDLELRLSL